MVPPRPTPSPTSRPDARPVTAPHDLPGASDVPVREPGTRARSGNTMGRTRSALLAATTDCVARYGIRKTTMVDVAARSKVAKATLYNHFRTKDDVLAAVVEQHVADLVGACVGVAGATGLLDALALAAERIGGSPALRRAAEGEQALLAPLVTPGSARGWQVARDGVAAVLTAGRAANGPAQVEIVLRWATSQVLWPLNAEQARVSAASLLAGLAPSGRPALDEAPAPRTAPAPVAGLGWPS